MDPRRFDDEYPGRPFRSLTVFHTGYRSFRDSTAEGSGRRAKIQELGSGLGCRLPDPDRRTDKRVESFRVPCLDAGSTPATSTFGDVPVFRNVAFCMRGILLCKASSRFSDFSSTRSEGEYFAMFDFYRYFEEFFDRAGYPAVPDTEIHESVVNRMRRVPIFCGFFVIRSSTPIRINSYL